MSTQFTGKYVSLTTYRRDGTPVSTPVWFVSDNRNLLVETDGNSYKVKRIRRNDNVTVTACNAMGHVTGEVVSARAAILPSEELPRVERLLHRKYRLDYIFVLPIYLLVQRLRGRPLRYEKPVILSITPRETVSSAGDPSGAIDGPKGHVSGFVAPGFEEVRAEFERNFEERGEIGAAVAAYWRGDKVVDLWGGRRTPDGHAPWNEDTLIVFMSSTKGLAAMTVALANSRGWLDYDAPVARYWPEFAQNGKSGVTVRQLLGHEAGLVLLDEELRIEQMRDLDAVASVLARQKPAWPPGTRHGYHTMSLGLYMQELIRHVDPEHRTLGRFFHEEIAVPLGLELYIGLPPAIPDERLATVKTLSVARALLAVPRTPPAMLKKYFQPNSTIRKSFLFSDLSWNDRHTLEVELPAGNGVGTARAMARAYSAFAEGGAELGVTPATFDHITALPPTSHPDDEVIGIPTYFSLGFLRPGPQVWFGSSPRAFCAPGAGGSFAFADPDAHIGYAYVMNKLDFYYNDDPREKPLRDALYRAIREISAGTNVPISARIPTATR